MVGQTNLFEPTQQPPTQIPGLEVIFSGGGRVAVRWNGIDLGSLNLGNTFIGVGTKLFLPFDKSEEYKKWPTEEALKKAGFEKPDYYVSILDGRVGSLLIRTGPFETKEYEAALLIFKHEGKLYIGLFIKDNEWSYVIAEIRGAQKVPFGQEPASENANASGLFRGATYTPPSWTMMQTYEDPIAKMLESIGK